jgi:hypothetical protein
MARRRQGSDTKIHYSQILEVARLGHYHRDEEHILDKLLCLELRAGRVLDRCLEKVKDDLLLFFIPSVPERLEADVCVHRARRRDCVRGRDGWEILVASKYESGEQKFARWQTAFGRSRSQRHERIEAQ